MEFSIGQLPKDLKTLNDAAQMDDGVSWGALTDLAGSRIDGEGLFVVLELDGSGEGS